VLGFPLSPTRSSRGVGELQPAPTRLIQRQWGRGEGFPVLGKGAFSNRKRWENRVSVNGLPQQSPSVIDWHSSMPVGHFRVRR